MKTSELAGAALDWAVAKCEGLDSYIDDGLVSLVGQPFDKHYAFWMPSTEWEQAGPIIEKEQITIRYWQNEVFVTAYLNETEAAWAHGPTALIAAMRCYVASKMGAEVEVPDELKGG